jgi:hypothetical protein
MFRKEEVYMKKLVYVVAFLALCGLAKASSVYCGIEIYKQTSFTVEEGEQLKRLMPKYSDWINSYIVAVKEGMTASYQADIWLDQDDTPIRSAYVVKPNAEIVTLTKDGSTSFTSDTPEPSEFYTSLADLDSHWPSGDYVLHVTFRNGNTQTFTTTVPDYDTTPFPDIVSGSLSAGTNGQFSLDWSTVDGVYDYDVWAWEAKKNKDVYDSEDLYGYIAPPQSLTTAISGAYAGKGDYNIGVDASNNVASNNGFDVSFNSGANWWTFKNPALSITNSIDKLTVKAGVPGASKDSLSFAGLLDAIAADLIIAEGDDIVVTIDADNMPSPLEFRFPINDVSFKKGLYNYARTDNASTKSFKLDTKTGKMMFNAKNIDLTGLACPIALTITIGDYEADFVVDESIVNGGKALPLTLMMWVADSITASKATVKHAAAPNADSLTVTGTFTIEGSYNKTNDFAVDFGGQTFTIPGSQMAANIKSQTESCKNTICKEGGLMTATLDFGKCTFAITLTGVNLPPGEQTFGISVFGKYLEGTHINDIFVGKRTMTFYGCYNISDGFTLDKPETFKTVTSTDNNIDYAIKFTNDVTFLMVRSSENQLSLNPQPQNNSTFITPNAYMLSDGSNGAFLGIGQENYDPLDISVSVSTWTKSVKITGAQLAGQWKVSWIFDDNLKDNLLAPFETADETLTITDKGNGQVRVQGDNFDWTMNIVKNSLVPVGPIDSAIKYFSMVTDGDGISMTILGVETYDPTDVSARIGLAARVP